MSKKDLLKTHSMLERAPIEILYKIYKNLSDDDLVLLASTSLRVFNNVIGYKKFTKSQILNMISNVDILSYVSKNIKYIDLDLLDLNLLVKNNVRLKEECFKISDKFSNEYIMNKIKDINLKYSIKSSYNFLYELLIRRNILKKYNIKLIVKINKGLKQSIFNKLEKNIVFKVLQSNDEIDEYRDLYEDYDEYRDLYEDHHDYDEYDEENKKKPSKHLTKPLDVKPSYIKVLSITNSKVNSIMCELSFYSFINITDNDLKYFSIPLFVENGIYYSMNILSLQ